MDSYSFKVHCEKYIFLSNFVSSSPSDDDYFPSNTWASTPKCDPSPPPSPKPKKTAALKTSTCEICNKEISSPSYMRVHMRTHTGEKPFKCYTCGRGFITSSKMNRHVLTHGNDGEYAVWGFPFMCTWQSYYSETRAESKTSGDHTHCECTQCNNVAWRPIEMFLHHFASGLHSPTKHASTNPVTSVR